MFLVRSQHAVRICANSYRATIPRLTFSRNFISDTPPSSSQGNIRVRTVFGGLLLLGFSATAYGLYDFYTSLPNWPPEVRSDLRAGLKARNQGDGPLAVRFLHRAWTQARLLHPVTLTSLEVSGVAATLGGVLESEGRKKDAYDVYEAAFQDIYPLSLLSSSGEENTPTSATPGHAGITSLSGPERMRVASFAHRLGDLATSANDEERWRVLALETVLTAPTTGIDERLESEVELGDRLASEVEIATVVHSLGEFYTRQGKIEYAFPLYLKAISVLLPPPASTTVPPTPMNKCRAAQLMSDLSALAVHPSLAPTPAARRTAEAWAKRAYSVIGSTRDEVRSPVEECERTLVGVLFNLGALAEMSNDYSAAKEHFERVMAQARVVGDKAGVDEAGVAMRRLKRMERVKGLVSLDS